MGKKSKRNNQKQKNSVLEAAQSPAAALPTSQKPSASSNTTTLADAKYCVACGTANAPLLCPCSQVSFCNEDCSKKVWPDHRLICPAKAGKARKKDSRFLPGDIVKIHGMEGEPEMQWNGCLAEIQSFDKEKHNYTILFSTKENFEIKRLLAKKGNLELHLSVEDAAHAAHERDRRYIMKDYSSQSGIRAGDAVRRIRNPRKFVQKLKNHEPEYMMALMTFVNILDQNSEANALLCTNIMECGLAAVLLQDYMFPKAIDSQVLDLTCETNEFWFFGIVCLSGFLEFLKDIPQTDPSKFVKGIVQSIGSLILIMCSKKRRLCGSANDWCSQQWCFVQLLKAFCSSAVDSFIDAIYSLPEECWQALMEHLVLLATIDHKVFLRSSSDTANRTVGHDQMYDSIAFVMGALLDLNHVKVTPVIIQKFGLIPIPFGAQNYVGDSFASVAPKVFARMTLNKKDFPTINQHPELKMRVSLKFAELAIFVCRVFHGTSLLDSETQEASGYNEFTAQFTSWEEFVDRSTNLLQKEDSV